VDELVWIAAAQIIRAFAPKQLLAAALGIDAALFHHRHGDRLCRAYHLPPLLPAHLSNDARGPDNSFSALGTFGAPTAFTFVTKEKTSCPVKPEPAT
jgi:hypothetical protein